MLLGSQKRGMLPRYFKAFEECNPDEISACFTEDAQFRKAGGAFYVTGREAIRKTYAEIFNTNPEIIIHRSRFFKAGREILSISEVTMQLHMWTKGKHLVPLAQIFELAPSGLIYRLRDFIDFESLIPMPKD